MTTTRRRRHWSDDDDCYCSDDRDDDFPLHPSPPHRRRGRIHAVRTMYMARCAAAIEPERSEDTAAAKTELHSLSVDELAAKDLTTVLWTVDDKVITFPFSC